MEQIDNWESPQVLESPQVTDDIHRWEIYFREVVESKSVCKVRSSHLQQTAREREQVYLKQLQENAQLVFRKKALSQRCHAFQKQALELIKLRRRLAPDGSAVHQEAGVFLAIVKIHQAVQSLISLTDRLIKLHSRIETPLSELLRMIQQIGCGKPTDIHDLYPISQTIRNGSLDATVRCDDWLHLSFEIASNNWALPEVKSLALASAAQSCYLASGILGQQNDSWANTDISMQRWLQFERPSDPFLVACLIKDVGIWLHRKKNSSFPRIHHAELSAGLAAGITGMPAGVVRLVREHHECFDGSGLPAGINGTEQHFESRLIAVITRWCELYNQQSVLGQQSALGQQSETLRSESLHFCAIELASNHLLKETNRNRWEKLGTNLLLDFLDVMPIEKIAQPQFQRDSKPNWRIPRPHFLDASQATVSAPCLRNSLRK